MNRLPIRLRLTAVFAVVMSVVLTIIGSFLYYRTKANLDDSIASELRARQGALSAYASASGGDPRQAIPPGERFAQLLTPSGRVLASRQELAKALLTRPQARTAAHRRGFFEIPERDRYLAGPSRLRGAPVVAVVGASLADRERALEGLGRALLIGGPLALLLASAIGYATTAATLRPVEAMRRQAATIGRADASVLLPVPEVDDELRRLSDTLNEMLGRIALSAEHERAFVANASHELRTPLAALQAELELAERHPGTHAETLAAVRRSRQDVRRLITLANDLLALAQADEVGSAIRERIDVDDLLVAVADEARHQADAGRRVIARPSGLTVTGDEAAVRRAMRNLADNALSHGAGSVTLGADASSGNHDVILWVNDEGELDPSLEQRAFERFVRGADAVGRPGAGLGLSLVETIARDHGGSASLAPAPGGGVRASIRLPAARGHPTASERLDLGSV